MSEYERRNPQIPSADVVRERWSKRTVSKRLKKTLDITKKRKLSF
jgi:hypothetical protein